MERTIKTRLIAAMLFLTTLLSFTAPAFAAADYSELISSILDDIEHDRRKLLRRAPSRVPTACIAVSKWRHWSQRPCNIFVSRRLCNAQSL